MVFFKKKNNTKIFKTVRKLTYYLGNCHHTLLVISLCFISKFNKVQLV